MTNGDERINDAGCPPDSPRQRDSDKAGDFDKKMGGKNMKFIFCRPSFCRHLFLPVFRPPASAEWNEAHGRIAAWELDLSASVPRSSLGSDSAESGVVKTAAQSGVEKILSREMKKTD